MWNGVAGIASAINQTRTSLTQLVRSVDLRPLNPTTPFDLYATYVPDESRSPTLPAWMVSDTALPHVLSHRARAVAEALEVPFSRHPAGNAHGSAAAIRNSSRRFTFDLADALGLETYVVSRSTRDTRERVSGSRLYYHSKDVMAYSPADTGVDGRPPGPHVVMYHDVVNHLTEDELRRELLHENSIKVIAGQHFSAPAGSDHGSRFRYDPDRRAWASVHPGRTYVEKLWCWDGEEVFVTRWAVGTPSFMRAVALALSLTVGFLKLPALRPRKPRGRRGLFAFAGALVSALGLPVLWLAGHAAASLVTRRSVVHKVYNRQLSDHRRVSVLTPERAVTGLLHEYAAVLRDMPTVRRLEPVVRGQGSTRTMAMCVVTPDEGENILNIALVGDAGTPVWHSAALPGSLIHMLDHEFARSVQSAEAASANSGAKVAVKIPKVSHLEILARSVPSAKGIPHSSLVAWLNHKANGGGATETARFVEASAPLVTYGSIGPGYAEPPHLGGLRSWLSSALIDGGAFAAHITHENAQVAVDQRVEAVRNNVPVDGEAIRLATKFASLVREDLRNRGVAPLRRCSLEEVYERQPRPTQQAQLDDFVVPGHYEGTGKFFLKKEALGKLGAARIISPVEPHVRAQGAMVCYPLADALKKTHWYVSGQTILETGESLASALSGGAPRPMPFSERAEGRPSGVADADYSKMDGTVGQVERMLDVTVACALFASDELGPVMEALESMSHLSFSSSYGVKFESGHGQSSGSPDTSVGNTTRNAFFAWMALVRFYRQALPGTSLDLVHRTAYGALGFYAGDDGSTPIIPVAEGERTYGYDDFARHMVNVSKAYGKSIKLTFVPNGDPVPFLGRYYMPWAGSPNSCSDIKRQLVKFHVTARSADIPDEVVAVEKALSFCLTDLETPILGPYAYAVLTGAAAEQGRSPGAVALESTEHWNARPMLQCTIADRGAYVANEHEPWMDALLASQFGGAARELEDGLNAWLEALDAGTASWKHPPTILSLPLPESGVGEALVTVVGSEGELGDLLVPATRPPIEGDAAGAADETSSAGSEDAAEKGDARRGSSVPKRKSRKKRNRRRRGRRRGGSSN